MVPDAVDQDAGEPMKKECIVPHGIFSSRYIRTLSIGEVTGDGSSRPIKAITERTVSQLDVKIRNRDESQRDYRASGVVRL